METRTCKLCGINKPLTLEFYVQGKNKNISYWYKFCRICYNEKSLEKNRRYKSKNRKKLAEKQRSYHSLNKNNDANTKKLWYVKNRNYAIQKSKEKHYSRLKMDIIYRLKHIVSGAVRSSLKRIGTSKVGLISKFLPYNFSELKEHLEKQFEFWMTWENYGKYRVDIWNDSDPSTWTWNIDHIIPHSKFKYTSMKDQEFRDCWALSNIRPYSAKQNVIDGNRR